MVVDTASFAPMLRRVFAVISAALLIVTSSLLPYSPLPGVKQIAGASSNCQITSLSPHSAPSGQDTGFLFTITDSTDAIAWIKVTSPTAALSVDGASSDWLPAITYDTTQATFSGSAINPGNPIQVQVDAVPSDFPPSNWTVQASTDSGGASPMACTGDASVTVTDTTPPNILTLTADPAITSATVSWSTDKITNGRVDYGTTTSYGNTVTDASYSTGHTVTLSNLKPATEYHYMVTATDTSGNTTASVDGTFFTEAQPTSSVPTNNGGSTPVSTPLTNTTDTTPPTIMLTTTLPGVINAEPTLSGTATDNIAVVKVEYSVDGGKNWLAADKTSGLGGKKVTFSFTPLNLTDGTYEFVARAIDGGGNAATTAAITCVLDRQPPIVGGNVISFGPQVLVPDSSGVITTLPNIGLTINLSATGGADTVRIDALNANATKNNLMASFALHELPDSGLWTGTLSFTKTGDYQLTAYATDGAGNKTNRAVGNLRVVSPGVTLSADGPVAHAKITLYYLDGDSNEWTIWDGSPYGQTNPQTTGSRGDFSLLLPAGTYYAHVDANGYQSINSSTFTLMKTTPFNTSFTLAPSMSLGPVRLPNFSLAIQPISLHSTSYASLPAAFTKGSLADTPLGNLMLTNTDGAVERSVSWLGKPTVISIMSDWAPSASEEVDALSQLAGNSDVNVKVIGLQEGAARLNAIDAITGSNLVWLADPDSTTLTTINVTTIPVNYFVDRKSVIQSVVYGPMSYEQLLNALTNLP